MSQTHIGRFLFVSGSGLWAPDMRDDSDANAEIFNTRFCLLMTLSVRPGGISGEIKTIDSQDGGCRPWGPVRCSRVSTGFRAMRNVNGKKKDAIQRSGGILKRI